MLVEVFKTNVTRLKQAEMLLFSIHKNFEECHANFDLEDCDNILRVASKHPIHPKLFIQLLTEMGFEAELL